MIAAGQKVAPHLRIKELMDPTQRSAVPAASRRELNVLVFLRKGHKPAVFILTGSRYDGMEPLQRWQHKGKGGELVDYVKLSSQEYIHYIEMAMKQLRTMPTVPVVTTPMRDMWLLQDKAKPHTAHATTEHLQKMRPTPLRVLTLPTDSPDLTPCDSYFFAAIKGAWRRWCASGEYSWEQRVEKAKELLKNTDPDPFIDAMPLRWKACVAAEGWHIEQELEELKAQQ